MSSIPPDRVARALVELGVPCRPGLAEATSRALAGVTRQPHEPVPTWAVGGERVRRGASWTCSCAGKACAHAAAVILHEALDAPRVRWLLEAPAWEIALAPSTPAPPPAAHRGYVRYLVDPPTPGVVGLALRPVVIRFARADGAELQPHRYPRTLDALRALVDGLDPVDLDLHGAWCALERARRLEGHGPPLATRALARALLEPLSRAREVWWGDTPIRASPDPLRPHVVAERGPGGLHLRWTPALRARWDDVVLTEAGELRPLAADLPDMGAVGAPLPVVPDAEIAAFVDRIVVGRGVDVALPDGVGRVREPDDRDARVVLAEDGPLLRVRLDLVYARNGAERTVDDRDPPIVPVPDAGLVRRDLAWERTERDRFARDVPIPELRGDDAVAWLRDALPDLRRRWTIFGEGGLSRFRVVGALTPSVSVRSGEDWFDLDVRFEMGGRVVPAGPVIASWRSGARMLRLEDGALAELPLRWLERHGPSVDLLASARRAQRTLSRWHAWEASELLVEAGAEVPAWVTALARPEEVPLVPLPEGLRASLRAYQHQGYAWLLALRDAGLHGVLADEMGLGKTLQALAAIVATDGPSLVVAPTSVLHNWVAEAARFAPGLRVRAHHGTHRGDLDADLVVTTYGLLRRDAALAAVDWAWVVLDEGQVIKNPASLVARATRRLKARHRLVLTGTPLENQLTDLWSLFRFLMPGLLGTRRAFQARYAGPTDRDDRAPALAELGRRLRPFLLRRRKDQVAAELPPRTERVLRIPLSSGERRLYDSLHTTARQALADGRGPDGRTPTVHLLEALTRLRQACCDPSLLPFPEARRVRRSSKVDAVLGLLAQAPGRRALVFSTWPAVLRRVGDALSEAGVGWLLLDGRTVDREGLVRRFQAPDGPPVFLISTKAGGLGLNLTAAELVFHLDPWWNPAVEDQATDRAHRIGQTRPVTVYKLVAADTIEEKVARLQARKRGLFERVVDAPTYDAIEALLSS